MQPIHVWVVSVVYLCTVPISCLGMAYHQHFYTFCFTDISAEAVYHENGFKRWVDMLKEFMEEEFNLTAKTPGQNHRLVHFDISYRNVTLPVDLLVSPYWNKPEEFYNFLSHIRKEKRDM